MNNLLQPCFGYDTLFMNLPLSGGEQKEITRIIQDLPNCKETKQKNGHTVLGGNMENLKIWVSDSLNITGSFSKFYTGQNIIPFSVMPLRDGIDTLNDTLHLNLFKAAIKRIDIATTIQTEAPPKNYFPYLGNYLKYRNVYNYTTLTYTKWDKNSPLVFQFYDKVSEIKNSKESAPKGINLMRSEMRFIGSKGIKELKHPSVITAQTLCNPTFFNTLNDKFIQGFEQIKKVNAISSINIREMVTKEKFKSPKEVLAKFQTAFVKMFETEILDNLDSIEFESNKQKYKKRLREDIEDLLSVPLPEGNEPLLLNELEGKIRALRQCKV
jgi:hypothetical protein